MPESGRGPGVIVLHAWWGLAPFFEGVCDRLATAATIEEAEALQRRREDSKRTEADLAAAVEFLQAHEGVTRDGLATLSFSAGASWALLLSILRPERVDAVVTFYGTAGVTDYSTARGLPGTLRRS